MEHWKKVIRPDGRPVEFQYDALGKRTSKQYFGKKTRWIWNGNVPLHEWSYKVTDEQSNEEENIQKEPTEDIITWVFEAGTFIPTAKILDNKQYSIVSDYLGTPIQMYDGQGNKTWNCLLDSYGKVITFDGSSEFDCPFRYQGQYADEETGLFYNRSRYYDANTGNYLSQDPIGLAGRNPTLYGYVYDTNCQIDAFGLSGRGGDSHRGIQNRLEEDLGKLRGFNNVKTEGQIILSNGKSRFGDVIVQDSFSGKITEVHQIGDMRVRGEFRPSSRERGAIMDIREALGNDVKIVFHDKKSRVTLINPDKADNWLVPDEKHRKLKGGYH